MKKIFLIIALFFLSVYITEAQQVNRIDIFGNTQLVDSGATSAKWYMVRSNVKVKGDTLKLGKGVEGLIYVNGSTSEVRIPALVSTDITTDDINVNGLFTTSTVDIDLDGIRSTSQFADMAGFKIFGTDITTMFPQLSQPNTFTDNQIYNDSVTFNHRVHENAAYIGINVSRVITCGNSNVNVITTLLSADLRGRYITTTGWKIGDKVRLICEAGITLEHDVAGAGRLFLAGATDVTVSDTWIAFEFCLAPDGNWYEIGARN